MLEVIQLKSIVGVKLIGIYFVPPDRLLPHLMLSHYFRVLEGL